jgi:hypothetical protein
MDEAHEGSDHPVSGSILGSDIQDALALTVALVHGLQFGVEDLLNLGGRRAIDHQPDTAGEKLVLDLAEGVLE